MKYLKTFENHITIDLDDNDQIYLMTEYLRDFSLTKNSDKKKSIYDKIKYLFENGFNPNSNYVDSDIPFIFIFEKENVFNLDILKLFVKYGLSGKIAKRIIDSTLSYSFGSKNLQKIIALLDTDVDLTENIQSGAYRYNNLNFFEVIDELLKNESLKKPAEKLLKVAIFKKPEQYEKYLINKDSKKYNL